jgi:hypothetical protein
MSESLDWLVEAAIESMTVSRLAEGLLAMIEAGPRGKRSEHKTMLREHLRLDSVIPIERDVDQEYP